MSDSAEKPLVSFLLLAYNQEQFIREAVEGAFSQTYSPLEIILSDDCSSDQTFEIMREMARSYSGPHKIVLNRNTENLGLGAHYSTAMEITNGEIIAIAAGDDISLPWRTADTVQLMIENKDISCVSMALYQFENRDQVPQIRRNPEAKLKKLGLDDYFRGSGFYVNAPGRSFWRKAHTPYGRLIPCCPVEDGSLLFRCLLHGSVATTENIGVLYRWNGLNISSPLNISKISISAIQADILNTIEIAFKNGQISRKQWVEIREKMLRRMKRQCLFDEIGDERVSGRLLGRALASPELRFVDKLRIFRAAIRNRGYAK